MTPDEFAQLVSIVIGAAEHDSGERLSEPARVVLVDRLLQEFVIHMPSDVVNIREHQRQQQDITDAVKMAAATGKLAGVALQHGEPS